MKVESAEEFNTSREKVFVFETEEPVEIDDEIEVNGTVYKIWEIVLPTKPIDKNPVSLIV